MQGDNAHPLLQQTALSVNPFIDLPKAPTLPHNYASLPSTLPPSILSSPPAASNPDLSAYVTSSSGFAAHPKSIIAQNKALLEQIEEQRKAAETEVRAWEQKIRDRELAEKRKKAPGYLDTEQYILQPAKPMAQSTAADSINLMDEPAQGSAPPTADKQVDDLGDAMDRAFGRSELG
ncbi:hypothetical protein Slin15195_G045430 [Septoria linicola]|uniref:Uncharacterized protein n=1 Tax=Septoria linicola TaxID=215465 RepID=A0A9Q9EIL9_9PEZI|nr:hypothetical protein Slin14017_G048950 [Septoria linicola]USW51224.1 hypothetical protein Slin15195_G045430 [Septoria linicola]